MLCFSQLLPSNFVTIPIQVSILYLSTLFPFKFSCCVFQNIGRVSFSISCMHAVKCKFTTCCVGKSLTTARLSRAKKSPLANHSILRDGRFWSHVSSKSVGVRQLFVPCLPILEKLGLFETLDETRYTSESLSFSPCIQLSSGISSEDTKRNQKYQKIPRNTKKYQKIPVFVGFFWYLLVSFRFFLKDTRRYLEKPKDIWIRSRTIFATITVNFPDLWTPSSLKLLLQVLEWFSGKRKSLQRKMLWGKSFHDLSKKCKKESTYPISAANVLFIRAANMFFHFYSQLLSCIRIIWRPFGPLYGISSYCLTFLLQNYISAAPWVAMFLKKNTLMGCGCAKGLEA